MVFSADFIKRLAGQTAQHDLAKSIIGNLRVVFGTYDSAGVTFGNVDTGLKECIFFVKTPRMSAVLANESVISDAVTLPIVAGTGANAIIPLITTSNEKGAWMAIGR